MMMGFGLIWLLLTVLLFAYLTGWRPEDIDLGRPWKQHDQQTPLEILKERYARGEITKEEYERIRAALEE